MSSFSQDRSALTGTEKAPTFQLEDDVEDEYLEEHFEIGKRLGRGSFATVYVAKHTSTDRKVVVKKLDRIQQHQARLFLFNKLHLYIK